MLVLTADLKTTVATEKELTVAFEEHRDHGQSCGILLCDDDGAYLSATGEGFGPYILEWFPAEKTGVHLRVAEELKSREVLDAFLEFLRGGSAWREAHIWHEVEDEAPPWSARVFGRFFGKTE
jgi:hypothetical protein